MEMSIRIAKSTEFENIQRFYHTVIDLMQDAEYKPAWEKGVYPSDPYLKEALENGELWVDNTISLQCVLKKRPAASALLPGFAIRRYAINRAPCVYQRAFPSKSSTAGGADFFGFKAEDVGILAYFKDRQHRKRENQHSCGAW